MASCADTPLRRQSISRLAAHPRNKDNRSATTFQDGTRGIMDCTHASGSVVRQHANQTRVGYLLGRCFVCKGNSGWAPTKED
eukprot:2079789-Amphidinium_carterae.1